MTGGFIILPRGILQHPVFGARKPFSQAEAWIWLNLEAAYVPRSVGVKNGQTWSIVALERGQLTHARSYMAEAWGWTEKRVRTFLKRLHREGEIALQTGQLQTLITIRNYGTNQNAPYEGGRQNDGQRAGKGPEVEERKKERKNNMCPAADAAEGFARWYDLYPRKAARRAALEAYLKVVPAQLSAEDLLKHTTKFSNHWATRPSEELRFCPYPATWLRRGDFLDGSPEASRVAGQTNQVILPRYSHEQFTEEDWRECLNLWRSGEPWAERHWGLAPGQPGCRVPHGLLVDAGLADASSCAPEKGDQSE
jgi:hypothetical protein